MTSAVPRELWFTSTMSSDMMGIDESPSFEGLYMCALDQRTGVCLEPQLVVDKLEINGKHQRGLDLMNVSPLLLGTLTAPLIHPP